MLRPALALVAALALLALPSPASAEPDPMAGARAVGDCFAISPAQAEARDLHEKAVDCADDHTAVVTAVATLPAHLDWNSPAEEIADVENVVCRRAFDDLIGKDPVLRYRSQYVWFKFEPTPRQIEDGARWFDCMIAVLDDRRLTNLPRTLPRLSKDMPDSVSRCVTKRFVFTTCADIHAWRSSYAFYATGRPTQRNSARAAGRVCPRHVTSGQDWLRSWMDVEGKRFIVACYSKTRR